MAVLDLVPLYLKRIFKMKNDITYGLHNSTSADQHLARDTLRKLFEERPFPDELLLTNFGLFFRASALAKVFFLHDAMIVRLMSTNVVGVHLKICS